MGAGDYNLSSNGKFRIRCDASANGDQVYIDAVEITRRAAAFASPNGYLGNAPTALVATSVPSSQVAARVVAAELRAGRSARHRRLRRWAVAKPGA